MSKSELRGAEYFRISDASERGAPEYRARTAPSLVTAEEYFASVTAWKEWYKSCEEKALSEFYGADVTVEISD